MARAMFIKIFLLLIIAALVVWNLFLRSSIQIPYLSGLSQIVVWIIAGAILVIEIIINLAGGRKYKYNPRRNYNPYGNYGFNRY